MRDPQRIALISSTWCVDSGVGSGSLITAMALLL
jgi:hypothetical protein